MNFWDELDLYLTEDKDTDSYDIYPVDYDLESGVSFGIEVEGEDEPVAEIIIRTLDGIPIDALAGDYDYADVYVDMKIKGDVDDPRNRELVNWSINKFTSLGYDENTIRIDGKEYYENPETANDEVEEPTSSDAEGDFSKYWDKYEDEDGAEEEVDTETETTELSDDSDDLEDSDNTDIFTDEEEPSDDEEDTEDEEESEEEEPVKPVKKKVSAKKVSEKPKVKA